MAYICSIAVDQDVNSTVAVNVAGMYMCTWLLSACLFCMFTCNLFLKAVMQY